MTDQQQNAAPQDENKLIAQRREKLQALRSQGNAFPNDFRRDALAADLHARFAEDSKEVLEHCRAAGPHWMGCWVVDMVLGKD